MTVLCGAFVFASASFAHGATPNESTMLDNEMAPVVLSTDQVDPLILTVAPYVWNGGWNIRCTGSNTGRATATTTGGVAPYTYSWSAGFPVSGGTVAVGLFVGTYSVTVTDAVGSTMTQSFTLIEPTPLVASVDATEILCNGETSTVTVSATGGSFPYNGTTITTGLTPDTYSYTVADANGCRNVVSVTITEPAELFASAIPTPIECYGDMSTIAVDAVGGTLPYLGVGSFTGGAGTYDYLIVDANGCSENVTLAVNQPGKLNTMVTKTDIDCYGGTSLVTVFSGTEPYLGSGGTAPYTGAGTYTYTVTDANGCSVDVSITVTEPT